MQIKRKLTVGIFVLALMGLAELRAQLTMPSFDIMYTVPVISRDTIYPGLSSILLDNQFHSEQKSFISKDNVYNTHFGFFCKQEAKRDKSTGVPIRMRLGTLQEVNGKEYGN